MAQSRKERRRAIPTPKAPAAAASASTPWILLGVVFAVTFAAFIPTLQSGFVNWDDPTLLLKNLAFRGFGWRNIHWMFTSFLTGPYQPLSWLSYAFDYELWGMNPHGYHLTNVVLHGLDAAVFCASSAALLERVRPSSSAEDRSRLWFGAAVGALVFSLHPLRVESVAWVTERRDVLSGLFYLLTILFYLRAQDAPPGDPVRRRRLQASLGLFVLSLMAKGIVVSLPLALIVLDVYPLGRLSDDPRRWLSREAASVWLEKIPYFLLSLVFGVVGIYGQSSSGAMESVIKLDFPARVAQASHAALFYLWKSLIPVGLSATYRPDAGIRLLAPVYLSCLFVIVAATSAAFLLRRKYPALLAVWAFYLVTLALVSGIVHMGGQAAADRYTYLPCLGWALLAGGLIAGWLRREGTGIVSRGVALAPLAILFALTWSQAKVWTNSETLWKHAISLDDQVPLAHDNLGQALSDSGRPEEAIRQYSLIPGYARAQKNWGITLMGQGRADEAVAHYQEALNLSPDDPETLSNLCAALCSLNRLDEAQRECERGMVINPKSTNLHVNLGVTLAKNGRLDDAAAHFRAALAIDPADTQARDDLRMALNILSRRPSSGAPSSHPR